MRQLERLKKELIMYESSRLLQLFVFSAITVISSSRLAIAVEYSAADFSSTPSILSQNVAPMVLFGMSNDHQLYYKAYTDYDDLDNDGTIDTTYLHKFRYYGYFDSTKCYDYDKREFIPESLADDDNYCTGSNKKYWSGNYLNWATMSRIDTVRKLLYGGLRSTDTKDKTVLERSYLPNDAHSFAKFYNGSDLDKLTPFSGDKIANGITICNTTVNNNNKYSQNVTNSPLIRVAKGDYSLWAANERWQCRWHEEKDAKDSSGKLEYQNFNNPAESALNAASSNPKKSDVAIGKKNYKARVQVCVEGLIGAENCKQYPDGNYKPIGLVQKYGDDDIVHFGLLTGSYTKNKSGGVLRKNVGTSTDEVNTTTDGTFKKTPTAGSIISTLNLFRLYGYDHNQGFYNNGSPGDDCGWGKSSFINGNCSNWGNPVAEILSECYRYYGGKRAAFNADDSGRLSYKDNSGNTTNLKTATWKDPLSTVNECAKLNVIMLNASSISYDADELSYFDSSFGTNVTNSTKQIGDAEEITNKKYFVGENGTYNNQLCTSKTVTNLGDVLGTCPDAPRLGGSYKMAGAAYFAKTNDIRGGALNGVKTVTTYGVELSPSVPSITIPVPGSDTKKVKILPACRNTSTSPDTNCAIVDFKISQAYQEDPANTGEFIGTLYVNWEDSEQGGDYDQDMWGTIKYRITSSKIKITTDVIAQSTPNEMGFGYVVSGTLTDGFHVHSGINNMKFEDANASIKDCSSGCSIDHGATSQSYDIGTSSAELLKSPLFYAAKWGGFTDLTGDNKPTISDEWDKKDNYTGDTIAGGDGIPDNYFLATNPSQLEFQLKQVLDSIIAKTASGASAAVVANSTSGTGAIYQVLYQPQATIGNDTVEWIGSLNGIFIDDKAHLREDANSNGKLDGYDVDKIIKISYSASDGDTHFQRYSTSDGGKTTTAEGASEPLRNLKPVWNAVNQLASLSNEQVRAQRGYTNNAAYGRYIFTAVGTTNSGIVNGKNKQAFTAEKMKNLNAYLAVDSDEAEDLVNYIRGDDSVANSRNRSLDFLDKSGREVWRLGDIIHSAPIIASSPDAGYDVSHADSGYGKFVEKYRGRRQMVYVGANDGMLHAFNGGFWDEDNQQFKTQNDKETKHPLGAELWAYVPTNLLPHLQWLKDPDYPHVYYMDGEGITQDVKIFANDATHPNGWGTILVMGMRFGGGAMNLSTGQTTGSGYVIMDITDPEEEPVLLAEITAPEFGFTTGKPAIIQKRILGKSTNEWSLVFGSGPHGDTSLVNGHSDQKARIIKIDLKKVYSNYVNSGTADIYVNKFSPNDDIGEDKSLIGNITVTDWDQDLIDDVLYFGTSSLKGGNVEGKLMRLALTGSSANTLVDVERPVMSAPLTGIDSTSGTHRWVMAGTGRFMTQADLSDARQQWFIGVKESKESNGSYKYTSSVNFDDLVDTTDIRVYSDGSLLENSSEYRLGGDTISNFDEMKSGTVDEPTAGMIGQEGWMVRFEHPHTVPSGRSVGPAVADPVNSGVFAFTEYVPPSQMCEVNGNSFIWSLSFETGTSTYYAPLGQDTSLSNPDGGEYVYASNTKIPAGGGSGGDDSGKGTATGIVTKVTYHNGTEGLKMIASDSTGGISTITVQTELISGGQGRQSWRQIDTSKFY